MRSTPVIVALLLLATPLLAVTSVAPDAAAQASPLVAQAHPAVDNVLVDGDFEGAEGTGFRTYYRSASAASPTFSGANAVRFLVDPITDPPGQALAYRPYGVTTLRAIPGVELADLDAFGFWYNNADLDAGPAVQANNYISLDADNNGVADGCISSVYRTLQTTAAWLPVTWTRQDGYKVSNWRNCDHQEGGLLSFFDTMGTENIPLADIQAAYPSLTVYSYAIQVFEQGDPPGPGARAVYVDGAFARANTASSPSAIIAACNPETPGQPGPCLDAVQGAAQGDGFTARIEVVDSQPTDAGLVLSADGNGRIIIEATPYIRDGDAYRTETIETCANDACLYTLVFWAMDPENPSGPRLRIPPTSADDVYWERMPDADGTFTFDIPAADLMPFAIEDIAGPGNGFNLQLHQNMGPNAGHSAQSDLFLPKDLALRAGQAAAPAADPMDDPRGDNGERPFTPFLFFPTNSMAAGDGFTAHVDVDGAVPVGGSLVLDPDADQVTVRATPFINDDGEYRTEPDNCGGCLYSLRLWYMGSDGEFHRVPPEGQPGNGQQEFLAQDPDASGTFTFTFSVTELAKATPALLNGFNVQLHQNMGNDDSWSAQSDLFLPKDALLAAARVAAAAGQPLSQDALATADALDDSVDETPDSPRPFTPLFFAAAPAPDQFVAHITVDDAAPQGQALAVSPAADGSVVIHARMYADATYAPDTDGLYVLRLFYLDGTPVVPARYPDGPFGLPPDGCDVTYDPETGSYPPCSAQPDGRYAWTLPAAELRALPPGAPVAGFQVMVIRISDDFGSGIAESNLFLPKETILSQDPAMAATADGFDRLLTPLTILPPGTLDAAASDGFTAHIAVDGAAPAGGNIALQVTPDDDVTVHVKPFVRQADGDYATATTGLYGLRFYNAAGRVPADHGDPRFLNDTPEGGVYTFTFPAELLVPAATPDGFLVQVVQLNGPDESTSAFTNLFAPKEALLSGAQPEDPQVAAADRMDDDSASDPETDAVPFTPLLVVPVQAPNHPSGFTAHIVVAGAQEEAGSLVAQLDDTGTLSVSATPYTAPAYDTDPSGFYALRLYHLDPNEPGFVATTPAEIDNPLFLDGDLDGNGVYQFDIPADELPLNEQGMQGFLLQIIQLHGPGQSTSEWSNLLLAKEALLANGGPEVRPLADAMDDNYAVDPVAQMQDLTAFTPLFIVPQPADGFVASVPDLPPVLSVEPDGDVSIDVLVFEADQPGPAGSYAPYQGASLGLALQLDCGPFNDVQGFPAPCASEDDALIARSPATVTDENGQAKLVIPAEDLDVLFPDDATTAFVHAMIVDNRPQGNRVSHYSQASAATSTGNAGVLDLVDANAWHPIVLSRGGPTGGRDGFVAQFEFSGAVPAPDGALLVAADDEFTVVVRGFDAPDGAAYGPASYPLTLFAQTLGEAGPAMVDLGTEDTVDGVATFTVDVAELPGPTQNPGGYDFFVVGSDGRSSHYFAAKNALLALDDDAATGLADDGEGPAPQQGQPFSPVILAPASPPDGLVAGFGLPIAADSPAGVPVVPVGDGFDVTVTVWEARQDGYEPFTGELTLVIQRNCGELEAALGAAVDCQTPTESLFARTEEFTAGEAIFSIGRDELDGLFEGAAACAPACPLEALNFFVWQPYEGADDGQRHSSYAAETNALLAAATAGDTPSQELLALADSIDDMHLFTPVLVVGDGGLPAGDGFLATFEDLGTSTPLPILEVDGSDLTVTVQAETSDGGTWAPYTGPLTLYVQTDCGALTPILEGTGECHDDNTFVATDTRTGDDGTYEFTLSGAALAAGLVLDGALPISAWHFFVGTHEESARYSDYFLPKEIVATARKDSADAMDHQSFTPVVAAGAETPAGASDGYTVGFGVQDSLPSPFGPVVQADGGQFTIEYIVYHTPEDGQLQPYEGPVWLWMMPDAEVPIPGAAAPLPTTGPWWDVDPAGVFTGTTDADGYGSIVIDATTLPVTDYGFQVFLKVDPDADDERTSFYFLPKDALFAPAFAADAALAAPIAPIADVLDTQDPSTQGQPFTPLFVLVEPRAVVDDGDGVAVDESQAIEDSVDVYLSTRPVGTVTVTASSGGQVELSADGTTWGPTATLTFDASGIGSDPYATPQKVFVRGVDDDVVESTHADTITFAVASDTDRRFTSSDPATVPASIADNDASGIVVEGADALEVSEAGTTDAFTVLLDSQPTGDVVVAAQTTDGQALLAVGAGPAGASRAIHFGPANWSVPQTFTVSAVDDLVREGPTTDTVTFTVTSVDPEYDGHAMDPATVDVIDDDAASITVDAGTGLSVTEGASADTFTVVLDAQPTAPVTVTVSTASDQVVLAAGATTGAASVDLTFTAADFTTAQTVSVSAVDDDSPEEAKEALLSLAVDSADADYDALTPSDLTVAVLDDDVPGVTVDPSTGLEVDEDGATSDTFVVRLNTQPAADVQVEFADATGDVLLSSGGSEPGATVTLTFTAADWDDDQTVTVTAVDDDVAEGDHAATLTSTVTSADTVYDGIAAPDPTVDIADDDVPGVTVANPGGLAVNEEGPTSDSFTLALDTQPSADVTIVAGATGDDVEVSTDGVTYGADATVTFTTSDWQTTQTIHVRAIDDVVIEGPTTDAIEFDIGSDDAAYAALTLAALDVAVADNDEPGITVDDGEGLSLDEASADTASFTVVLTGRPANDVTITVTLPVGDATLVDDTDEDGSVELVFTPAAYNVPQAVELAVVDDDLAESAEQLDVTFAVSSEDAAYDAFAVDPVTVAVTDDDTAGLDVDAADDIAVAEDGPTEATFTVGLQSQPFEDVIVYVNETTGEATLSADGETFAPAATLTFTPADWATKTVTVRAIDDAQIEGDHQASITVESSSLDAAYDALSAADVTVAVDDDDVADVIVEDGDGMSVAESGATSSTFKVALSARPDSDVTITLTLAGDDVATGDATLDGAAEIDLVFTGDDWNVLQSVVLAAVDDAVDEEDETGDVVFAVASDDPAFGLLGTFTGATFTIVDDDEALVNVEPATLTVVEGTQEGFEISLDSTPSGDVVIDLALQGTDLAGVSLVDADGAAVASVTLSDTTPVGLFLAVADDGAWGPDRTVVVATTLSADTTATEYVGLDVPDVEATIEALPDTLPPSQPGAVSSTEFKPLPDWVAATSGTFTWAAATDDDTSSLIRYTWALNATPSTNYAAGNATRTIGLSNVPEGSHVFRVRAIDASGNAGPVREYAFGVDRSNPVPGAISASSGLVACSTTPTVQVSWSGGSDSLSGLHPTLPFGWRLGSASETRTSAATTTVTLSSSSTSFTVNWYDALNRSASRTATLLYDGGTPTVTLSGPNATNGGVPLSFQGADDCSSIAQIDVEARKGENQPYHVIYSGTGNSTVYYPDRGQGTYFIRARAIDGAGREGNYTADLRVVYDTTEPGPPAGVRAEAHQGGARITWTPAQDSGSESSGVERYEVTRSGGPSGSFQASGDLILGQVTGTSYADPRSNVVDGVTYTYRVRAVDAAGNKGPASEAAVLRADHAIVAGAKQEQKDAIAKELGIEFGASALTALDTNGDGIPDDVTSRGSSVQVDRTAPIGGEPALLLKVADAPPRAIWIPSTDQVLPLQPLAGTVGGPTVVEDQTHVDVTIPAKEGWILIDVPDPHPALTLSSVVTSDGRVLPVEFLWQENGRVYVLDDPETVYTLVYNGTEDASSAQEGGGESSTGVSPVLVGGLAVLGLALMAGALAIAFVVSTEQERRRRQP